MSQEFEYKIPGKTTAEDNRNEICAFNNIELRSILTEPMGFAQFNLKGKIQKIEQEPKQDLKPNARKLDERLPELARAADLLPLVAKPEANLQLNAPMAKPEDDVFQLSTGHTVCGSKGRYRITDQDGNLVRIFPNGLEATGKVLSQSKDQSGNTTVKFENGSTVFYNPSGRLTLTGADRKSSTITLQKVPFPPVPDPLFRSFRRNLQP